MAIGVTGLALLMLIPNDLVRFGRTLISSILFVSNIQLAKKKGYFDESSQDDLFLHTWSLSIEEQFYLLWPFILIGILAIRWRPSVFVLLVISFIYAEWAIRIDPRISFYGLPARAWELLLGASLALGLVPVVRSKLLAEMMAAAGLGMMSISALVFGSNSAFPGVNALLPCLGAAFIIHAGSSYETRAGKILSFPPLVFCGLISYSLYLWHWPLLSLGNYYIGGALAFSQSMILVCVSFIIAALSWRFVETPFRRLRIGERNVYARAALYAAPALAVCLIIAGAALQKTKGLPWRMPAEVLAADRAKQPLRDREKGCASKKKGAFAYDTCEFGAAAEPRQYRVILWGDSHARHYLPAIASLSTREGVAGLAFTAGGCPPLLRAAGSGMEADDASSPCARRNEEIMGLILGLPSADLVIIAARWSVYFDTATSIQAKDKPVSLLDTSSGRAAAGLRQMVNRLSQAGIPVLIMGEAPRFASDVPRCVARRRLFGQDETSCTEVSRRKIEERQASIDQIFERIAQSAPNVRLFSPLNYFCDATICRAQSNSVVLYRDDHHLNREGAKYIEKFIDFGIRNGRAGIIKDASNL